MVNNLIILSDNRYSRAALKVISEDGNNLIDCLAIFMRYSKTGEEDGFLNGSYSQASFISA